MTIGERIKQRREELEMTQEELAKKCGYKSRSSINKIELSRDLPLKKVQLMATALETTPAALMGWTELHEVGHNILTLKEQIEKDPKKTVDTVLFNNNEKIIKISEDVNEALELYKLYEKADPTVKAAIDTLLKKKN